MKIKQIIPLLLIVTVSCFMTMTNMANAETLDSIVATVNDDVITQSELQRALKLANIQIARSGMKSPSPSEVRKEVLDQLIDRQLQLQLAKQAKISVSNKEVDAMIQSVADRNHISRDTLYRGITQDGLSISAYRGMLHDQLLMQKLSASAVQDNVHVSENEAADYAKSHQAILQKIFHRTPSKQEVRAYLLDQAYKKAVDKWMGELRKQAYIVIEKP